MRGKAYSALEDILKDVEEIMDESLKDFEDKWVEKQEHARAWDDDEIERFGVALPSKVEALEYELDQEISKLQIAVCSSSDQ
jgi:hypothetical protein